MQRARAGISFNRSLWSHVPYGVSKLARIGSPYGAGSGFTGAVAASDVTGHGVDDGRNRRGRGRGVRLDALDWEPALSSEPARPASVRSRARHDDRPVWLLAMCQRAGRFELIR